MKVLSVVGEGDLLFESSLYNTNNVYGKCKIILKIGAHSQGLFKFQNKQTNIAYADARAEMNFRRDTTNIVLSNYYGQTLFGR